MKRFGFNGGWVRAVNGTTAYRRRFHRWTVDRLAWRRGAWAAFFGGLAATPLLVESVLLGVWTGPLWFGIAFAVISILFGSFVATLLLGRPKWRPPFYPRS